MKSEEFFAQKVYLRGWKGGGRTDILHEPPLTPIRLMLENDFAEFFHKRKK
jgi:hypothetical protein